jgi:protein gp37
MSDGTHIEWTDASWNPLRARREPDSHLGWACVRVSAGCTHCYAATINKRLGTGLDYTVPAMAAVSTYLDEGALVKPLSWRKPRKVFVCSMTDLFGEWVTDEQIDRVFAVMALSRQHTFQVLTKRPERMRAYLSTWDAKRVSWIIRERAWDLVCKRPSEQIQATRARLKATLDGTPESYVWPLPNVWLGTSVEDQPSADARIPELLACPAAVRGLSCEPLLGPVELGLRTEDSGLSARALTAEEAAKLRTEFEARYTGPANAGDMLELSTQDSGLSTRIEWVIVGGESGPGARPMDVSWARALVAQCREAGVAVFVKQLGARPFEVGHRTSGSTSAQLPARLLNRKGGDMTEWPADLRVREFPAAGYSRGEVRA